MNSSERKNVISVIAAWTLVTVLAALVCSLLLYYKKNDEENRDISYRLESEILALKVEKSELLREKNSLDGELLVELGVAAAVGITLLDMDEAFFETLYTIFGGDTPTVAATVCLSREELPGAEGKITLERYLHAIGVGWDAALLFESEEEEPEAIAAELDAFLTDMKLLLEPLGIPLPTCVLFDKIYYLELDAVLAEHGITAAAHRSEAGLPAVEQEATEGVMWHPGMVGWNDGGAPNMLNGLVNTGGYFMYTIGVGEARRQYDRFVAEDKLHTDSIRRMASLLVRGEDAGVFKLLNYDEAYAFRCDYVEAYLNRIPDVDARKAEIDAEVAIIDKQILEIYKKYGF